MEYKKTNLDNNLSALMQGADGEKFKKTLDNKIVELEAQLEQFKIQLNFCDEQFSLINIRIQNVNNPIKIGYYREMTQIFSDHKLITNIGCYLTTLSTDIKSIQKGLYFETTEWSRRNSAKHMCTTLYEACRDIPELFGKKFRELTTSRIDISTIQEEYNEIRSRLKKYEKENMSYFHSVRNNTSAHRSQDTLEQLSITEKIDWSSFLSKVLAFESIINDLGAFMQKVTDFNFDNLRKSPKGRGLI